MSWRGLRSWYRHHLRLAEGSVLVAAFARVGYAARGVVYLSIGVMALLAAFRLTPHADGAVDALRAWAQWQIGVFLLWITALGLCAFAIWRALQSVFDIEHLGIKPAALTTRIGKAVSGLLYGSLGVSVLRLLDNLRDLRKGSDQANTEEAIGSALVLPFGRSLVIALGVGLVLVGLGNMVRAFLDHFTHSLHSSAVWKAPIGILARMGYFARGVVFLPAGYFTILAGWRAHAHEAVSAGAAMDWFMSRPYGHAFLAAQGLGLGAFGLFGLIKAGFRKLGSTPAKDAARL